MPEALTEAGTVLEAAPAAAPGRYRILCISEGRGSSGVYPASTLQEAARNNIIPAGTQIFADHPSATEEMDRPERSIRDLAGVTTSDAKWSDEHSGLVSEARFFAPYQPLVADMGDAIGMSIRGDGEIEMREGQRTVTNLAHVHSVDLVTRAGRGGKVLELLESARTQLAEARNIGQHMESRMHQDFTNRADDMAANGHLSRDERIHLSNAVGQGLSTFASHLEQHAPQLYQRDIYDEPAAPAVGEGAPAPTTPTITEEGLVPELTEAEVTALRDQAAQAAEAQRQLAEATAALTALQARDAARPLIAAHLGEATEPLPALAQARVVEAILAAGVPTTEQGAVDTAALNTAVEAAATAEGAYLAALAPAPVREGAFGALGSQQGKPEGVAEADAIKEYDALSAGVFGRNTVKGN